MLYGTMKPARYWLLLEYNQPFAERALEAAPIPQAVKDKLMAFANSRTLLIRQPGLTAEADGKIRFYLVDAGATQPAYLQYDLANYTDLLALDFECLAQDDAAAWQTAPLYLVCTNGKRDVCCAVQGLPLYRALSEIVGDAVWQVNHFGGHRFAAVTLLFPHALAYGRLDQYDAPDLAQSYADGRVLLKHFRAQASVPKPVQVAEYFLRQDLEEMRLSSLRYEAHTLEDDIAEVCFKIGTSRYRVRVQDQDLLGIERLD